MDPPVPRLRAVARYSSAPGPAVLAVSPYVPAWQTSLVAVATTQGALTVGRLDQLRRPLRRWPSGSGGDSGAPTQALAFGSPNATSLWQGRPTHILGWDIGQGVALSSRFHVPTSGGSILSLVVPPAVDNATSSSSSLSSYYTLAACTPLSAFAFDAREGSPKPVLRWGGAGAATTQATPYVQMAESGSNPQHMGLLQADGVLTVWDIRYTSSGNSSLMDTTSTSTATPVHTLPVCTHRGIGLQALGGDAWVVWGLDDTNASEVEAVTKIVGPSPKSYSDNDNTGQCMVHQSWTTPDLACVRVCGSHLVTVRTGHIPPLWRADVYSYQSNDSSSNNKHTAKPVVSFSGSASTANYGPLQASQCAWSTYGPTMLEQGVNPYTERTGGLVLVHLTHDGTLTTHSVPEAMEGLPMEDDPPEGIETATVSPPYKLTMTAPTSPLTFVPRVTSNQRDWGDVARAFQGRVAKDDRTETMKDTLEDPSMPFDMDVPVAYSIPSTDVQQTLWRGGGAPNTAASLGTSPPNARTVVADGQTGEVQSPVRVNVDTKQLPCPRLCGATFGPDGALVVFGNGQVHRMWTWYSSSVAQPTHGEKKHLRTMHDLLQMREAGKEAQWGKHLGSEDLSVASQQLGLGFFEDDGSDDGEDSTDSVDREAEDLLEMNSDKVEGMYENYFGDFRRPLIGTLSGDEGLIKSTSESGDSVGGPSSDMLAPVVKVSRSFGEVAMHLQNRQLALHWKLGELVPDSREPSGSDHVVTQAETPSVENEMYLGLPSALAPSRLAFPSLPKLASHQPGRLALSAMSSSPSEPLLTLPKKGRLPVPAVPNPYDMDEAGVHGGVRPVRPHVKESKVFLKKLINYQQESGGMVENPALRGMTPPPDSPTPLTMTRTSSLPTVSSKGSTRRGLPGVYVARRASPANTQTLESMKAVCGHNAKASKDLGQAGKADTWRLLAQVVAGRMHVRGSAHWKPKANLAVGSKLVQLILKYYETRGDVQMLATIVCVLRQDRDPSNGESTLLPEDTNGRYDGYLRRYADLLYAWGLISLRAEVNKRLKFTYERREVFGVPSKPGDGTGISIFSKCPRCLNSASGNYCTQCLDFVFRCILCDMPVRGIFTVCRECGHGGHAAHMNEWFKTEKQCPTGCGCRCTLVGPQVQ